MKLNYCSARAWAQSCMFAVLSLLCLQLPISAGVPDRDRAAFSSDIKKAEEAERSGELNLAESIYQSMLARARKQFGSESPEYIRAAESLARYYLTKNRLREAEQIARDSRELSQKLGSDKKFPHSDFLINDCLGRALAFQGKYEDAEKYFLQALKTMELEGAPVCDRAIELVPLLTCCSGKTNNVQSLSAQMKQALKSSGNRQHAWWAAGEWVNELLARHQRLETVQPVLDLMLEAVDSEPGPEHPLLVLTSCWLTDSCKRGNAAALSVFRNKLLNIVTRQAGGSVNFARTVLDAPRLTSQGVGNIYFQRKDRPAPAPAPPEKLPQPFKLDEKQVQTLHSLPRNLESKVDKAQDKLQSIILTDGFSIGGLAFSPDGKWIASNDTAGAALWDVTSCQQMEIFPVKSDPFSGFHPVAVSHNGKMLAAGEQNTLKIWNPKTKELLRSTELSTSCIAFSPDDRILACAVNKEVRLWSLESGRELKTLSAQEQVRVLAFSPDGKLLAGGEFNQARLWQVSSGKELFTLPGHAEALAFSPDGTLLASGGFDPHIRIWQVETAKELGALSSRSSFISSLVFCPDGRYLASGEGSGKIEIWDLVTGSAIAAVAAHENGPRSLVFSPDGKILASAEFRVIKLWDLDSLIHLRPSLGHSGSVWSVCYSPDSKRVVSGAQTGEVKIWDALSGKELTSFSNGKHMVRSAVFSPDGSKIAVAGDMDPISIWDAVRAKRLLLLRQAASIVGCLAYSPDGKLLASGACDSRIILWNPNSGSQLRTLNGHTRSVDAVAFSPDGGKIASGDKERTIKIWDSLSGKELLSLSSPDTIHSLAFCPDGNHLASCGQKGVRIWDLKDGKARTLPPRGAVYHVAVSPDGKRLACAGRNHDIRIFDLKSGKQMQDLQGHAGGVESFAFSPDGKRLASGGLDTFVKFWDLTSGKELFVLRQPPLEPLSVYSYIEDMLERLGQRWDQKKGHLPVLQLSLDHSGKLQSLSTLESSGDKKVDAAAITLVKETEFGPLPHWVKVAPLTIKLDLNRLGI
jgi:TonB family protein